MSRTPSFYRLFATAVAAGAVLFLIAACTPSSSMRSPSMRSPSNSVTPSGAASGSGAPPHRTVRLSCTDAGSGIPPADNGGLAIGGATLEGLAGDVEGSRPAEVGLKVPMGDTLYFFKAPAWLKAGATTTIELSPASGGYLAWVPAPIWTSGGVGGVDLASWMASKLVFDGCPDRDSTYFGGLLSADPNVCLTLNIEDASGKSQQIPVGSATRC